MKKLAYTPLPWEIEHRHCDGTIYDDEMSGLGIELIGPEEPMRGTFSKSADARIVVAAPEMYELLWRLCDDEEDTAGIVRGARDLLDRMHAETQAEGGAGS